MTPIVFNHALTTSVKKCWPYLRKKNGQVFGRTIKNHFATNHFMEKFFLLFGHVAKIKHANISYVKKDMRKFPDLRYS